MICYKNIKKPALRRYGASLNSKITDHKTKFLYYALTGFELSVSRSGYCVLFFHYGDAKEISHFTTFTIQKLWAIILMELY